MILFEKQTDEYHIAVWNVEEDIETLLSMIPDSYNIRMEADNRFHSDTRKKEWIATRALLYAMQKNPVEIVYADNGAPLLFGKHIHISISHTSESANGRNLMYVAVALSARHRIGIDIERISARVCKVKERFIGKGERADTQSSLLLHWSAKEAAFKVLSTEGVDFIRHLHIEPFTETEEGSFILTESKTEKACRMNVMYKMFNDFVLTFICTD
ncbi:MAG: 4'-phosphopantetheinyl transferase superfamily protein [Bacteroides sp.]|nr:4'-phosphopantetheinyl transferase superfamily protein [Roseburia sp.]MCM1345529.1 4'-phosphopantetheinyl transferase superfamily protein [Bacteroides sp.]MCM1420360.1 4'-phosphopantetheinyl transferase superfamily protein [Bacteroides sp.]